MKERAKKNVVFILSLFDTGLATSWILNRYHIQVLGFDYKKNHTGFFSNSMKTFLSPNPETKCKEFIKLLVSESKKFDLKPILIPASDEYVKFVNDNRNILKKNFLFLLPEYSVAKMFLNKRTQLEWAKRNCLNVPNFFFISDINDLQEHLHQLKFPLFLKPDNVTLWKKYFKEKGFRVNTKPELKNKISLITKKGIKCIAQEIISGDCTNNLEVSVFYDGSRFDDNIIAVRKIRQYPINYGFGCLVERIQNKEIENLAVKFVKDSMLLGFSNTEFKYDLITKKYYFIETNIRVWQQINITEMAGNNFALKYYNSLTANLIRPRKRSYKSKVKWIAPFYDFSISKRLIKNKNLSVVNWIKSLYGIRANGIFSISDLRPFLERLKIWFCKSAD